MKWFTYLFTLSIVQIVHCDDLSEIYSQLYSGNYPYAIERLEEMVTIDTSNQTLFSALAQAYTLTNEDQKAITVYEKLLGLDTSNVDYSFLLSKLLAKQGRLMQSMALVRIGLQNRLDHKGLLDLAGKISYEENNYSMAYQYYSQLIDMNYNPERYHHLRARCAVKMDHPSDAISDFEAVLRVNPGSSLVIYEYAHCLYTAQRFQEALTLIRREAEVFGGRTKYERLKGNIFTKTGMYAEAIESYSIALDRGKANSYLLKRIGICYYELADFEKGRDFLYKSTLLDSADPLVYYYLGKCEMEMGDYKTAIENFTMSTKRIQPSFIDELYINMGLSYVKSGDHVQAIRSYRKGLEVSPDDPQILYMLANVYNDYYLDKSVALEYYQKAAQSSIHPQIDEYIQHKIRVLEESQYFKGK